MLVNPSAQNTMQDPLQSVGVWLPRFINQLHRIVSSNATSSKKGNGVRICRTLLTCCARGGPSDPSPGTGTIPEKKVWIPNTTLHDDA